MSSNFFGVQGISGTSFWLSSRSVRRREEKPFRLPPLALGGLFERPRRMSAIGGKANVALNGSTDAPLMSTRPNSVSARALYERALFLRVPSDYRYEGYDGRAAAEASRLPTPTDFQLLNAYQAIESDTTRRAVRTLVQELAAGGGSSS